jgi:hypothetical protein
MMIFFSKAELSFVKRLQKKGPLKYDGGVRGYRPDMSVPSENKEA